MPPAKQARKRQEAEPIGMHSHALHGNERGEIQSVCVREIQSMGMRGKRYEIMGSVFAEKITG